MDRGIQPAPHLKVHIAFIAMHYAAAGLHCRIGNQGDARGWPERREALVILGALPEFPAIFSEEERLIFLGFMPENSAAAAQYFLWAERDGEIDFIERPFCPGSPIEPEFGLSQPSNFGRGGLGQRVAQDMQTQAMRAVGII